MFPLDVAHVSIVIATILHITSAADTYTPRGGRLAGNDILNGTYTYTGAAQMCSQISECAGFSWIDTSNNATFDGKKWVHFKPSIALVLALSSRSAIKNYPTHGPNKLATVFQFEQDRFPDGSVIPCVGGSSLITTASGVLLAFAICRCVNIVTVCFHTVVNIRSIHNFCDYQREIADIIAMISELSYTHQLHNQYARPPYYHSYRLLCHYDCVSLLLSQELHGRRMSLGPSQPQLAASERRQDRIFVRAIIA